MQKSENTLEYYRYNPNALILGCIVFMFQRKCALLLTLVTFRNTPLKGRPPHNLTHQR